MKHVEPNDFVAHLRSFQGGIEHSTLAGKVSTAYTVIEPLEQADPRFFRWVLKSPAFIGALASGLEQLRDGQSVKFQDFARIPLPLPPMQEQLRIADYLDDRVVRIDRIVAARRRQQALLDSQLLEVIRLGVAGVMGEGDSGYASPIPWLSRVSDQARVAKLARVLTLQRGVDLTADDQRPGSVPVITTAGVTGSHDVAIAKGPGVVIGRYGSVGSVHWVEEDYWPHNTTLYLKDAHGNHLRWAYYLLRSFPYSALQARSAVPGVNRNDMASEDVPIIPNSLQVRVADELDQHVASTATQKAMIERSVGLLTEYKQSLITAAVTGKLDVTIADSGIPG